MKVRDAFSISVEALEMGNNLLIFPEMQGVRTSEIVHEMQSGWITTELQSAINEMALKNGGAK